MKRFSTLSATATTSRHHHSKSSSSSNSSSNSNGKEPFPLYRSITDDNSFQNKRNDASSPITRFVCKLLGMKTTSQTSPKPSSWSKSQSTTSITKSSVISSYQPSFASPKITAHNNISLPSSHTALNNPTITITATKKFATIKIITPNSPLCTLSTSVVDWDRHSLPSSSIYLDEEDTNSVASTTNSSSSNITSSRSSVNFVNDVNNNSAAVDALVTASLMPTKKTNLSNVFDFPSIILQNRKPSTVSVLTETIAAIIQPYVPRRYRIASKWNMLYSIDEHGISLATLYHRMRDYEGPCMMIIKDADEQIFGAYLSNPLSSQTHYYGTGECFLWKLTSDSDNNKKNTNNCLKPKIKAYPWTGKNDYMILSDSDFIAIGGGNGKFGLCLNSSLDKGYTNTCSTFDNESLTLQPEFQCIEMEIWGFYI